MSTITWGMLQKSLVDNETIEQAIVRLITEHNNDETAHLGVGQSLQSHKASEVIDHLASSVVADKLSRFSIDLSKLMAEKIYIISGDIDLDAWEFDIDGNGTIIEKILGTLLRTGDVSGNETYIAIFPFGNADLVRFDRDIVFQVSFQIPQLTSQRIYFTAGSYYGGYNSFGFRIINNTLYALSVRDDYDKLTSIMNLSVDTIYVLRAELFASEQKILYFVNQQLKATHDSYIPTGTTNSVLDVNIETTENAKKELVIHDFFACFGR